MPSTPRMQEIERKASQPGGPALTQPDITEWHLSNVRVGFSEFVREVCRQTGAQSPYRNWWPSIDYSASIRYLDSQKPQK